MKRIAMMFSLLLIGSVMASPQTKIPVIGTWEGESVCQVPKPCTTEHVIYEITGESAEKITIKADKVVNGERQWMGDIQCSWSTPTLSCPMENRKGKSLWKFDLNGDVLKGTLVLEEGNVLFRKIEVKRKPAAK